jgi:hypothetical protein
MGFEFYPVGFVFAMLGGQEAEMSGQMIVGDAATPPETAARTAPLLKPFRRDATINRMFVSPFLSVFPAGDKAQHST